MFWSQIDIELASRLYRPSFLRAGQVPIIGSLNSALQQIADETLYTMQHNGTKIYLEKMLNETYQVPGYDPMDHEGTKLIYIDDTPEEPRVYVWQNEEAENTWLEDDGDDNEDDVFLDGDGDFGLSYSWIVYMPDTLTFNEYALRALIDQYRYIGKNYIIEIYTP